MCLIREVRDFCLIRHFATFRQSIETSEMRRTELIPPSIAQLAVLHPVHNVVLDNHLPFAITATHLCGQAPTPVNWSLLVTSSSSNSGLTQSAASLQPLITWFSLTVSCITSMRPWFLGWPVKYPEVRPAGTFYCGKELPHRRSPPRPLSRFILRLRGDYSSLVRNELTTH